MVEFIYHALQMTNQQILDGDINTELAGSTVIAVFIYQERILSFNVGDSRAILLQQIHTNFIKQNQNQEEGKLPKLSHMKTHEEYQWKIVPLSDDQKPDRPDQKQRILKFGGRVFAQTGEHGEELGPTRVWMKDVMMPGLAMTRSFGDKAGIKAGTNGEPELMEHPLSNEDKFMIIASDGIWQYMQNEEVMNTIVPFLMKDDINTAADVLLRKAVNVWAKMNFARDDITFIIVKLNSVHR